MNGINVKTNIIIRFVQCVARPARTRERLSRSGKRRRERRKRRWKYEMFRKRAQNYLYWKWHWAQGGAGLEVSLPPAGLHFSTLEGLVINTAFAPKNIVNVNPIGNSFPTRSQQKMQNKFPVEKLCKREHTGSNTHHWIYIRWQQSHWTISLNAPKTRSNKLTQQINQHLRTNRCYSGRVMWVQPETLWRPPGGLPRLFEPPLVAPS